MGLWYCADNDDILEHVFELVWWLANEDEFGYFLSVRYQGKLYRYYLVGYL